MYTVNGTYGSSQAECLVFVHDGWYAVQGSRNVNRTNDLIDHGVDVETLNDWDCFTASDEIECLADLVQEIDS